MKIKAIIILILFLLVGCSGGEPEILSVYSGIGVNFETAADHCDYRFGYSLRGEDTLWKNTSEPYTIAVQQMRSGETYHVSLQNLCHEKSAVTVIFRNDGEIVETATASNHGDWEVVHYIVP